MGMDHKFRQLGIGPSPTNNVNNYFHNNGKCNKLISNTFGMYRKRMKTKRKEGRSYL